MGSSIETLNTLSSSCGVGGSQITCRFWMTRTSCLSNRWFTCQWEVTMTSMLVGAPCELDHQLHRVSGVSCFLALDLLSSLKVLSQRTAFSSVWGSQYWLSSCAHWWMSVLLIMVCGQWEMEGMILIFVWWLGMDWLLINLDRSWLSLDEWGCLDEGKVTLATEAVLGLVAMELGC